MLQRKAGPAAGFQNVALGTITHLLLKPLLRSPQQPAAELGTPVPRQQERGSGSLKD